MPDMSSDHVVAQSINTLADEEHQLRAKEAAGTATDADRQRIALLEVELDRCWDLLRQREARRNAGLNPDDATERPSDIVEGYLQ